MESFSLERGGPFDVMLRRTGLLGPLRPRFTSAAIVFTVVAWVPFAVAAWVDRQHTGAPSIFSDLSIHARLLVALPLFFKAASVTDERCADTLRRIYGRLTDAASRGTFERIIARAKRARDSWIVEAAMLFVAFSSGQAILHGMVGSSAIIHMLDTKVGGGAHSLARVWYAWVSLPMFQFLFLRSLFRWGIWSVMLAEFARLDLHPVVTHPDRAGGLGFLSQPLEGSAVFILAPTSVVSAAWGTQVMLSGVAAKTFLVSFLSFALIVGLIVLAPLVVFAKPLYLARLHATREYDEVMARFTTFVDAAWVHGETTGSSPVGEASSSGLVDADSSYQNLRAMRVLPFGKQELIPIALALVGPMLPLVATQVPLRDLVKDLGHILLAVAAP